MATNADLQAERALALELAEAARRVTLGDLAAAPDNKLQDGGYDPVTAADRDAERAMRALIAARFPDHGIAGEEYGETAGAGRFVWSLDPIDGTRAFVCGLPSWTTLIALLDEGRPAVGVIDAPRLDELYYGDADQAYLRVADRCQALRASTCMRLGEARLSTTDPHLFSGAEAAAFERVRGEARLVRYGLDAYAYARLAAGTIDLVVESGLKPHDYNALIPVVRGAGGVCGNWRGEDDFSEGAIVAASTRTLFDETVQLLNVA